MRKTLSGLVVFGLLLVPTQFLNAATIIAGSTCPKFGQSQNANGLKYTCIKSGRKLVWSKGVTLTKPTPTITPTPSPTPAPSLTSTPSPTPSNQKYVPSPRPSQTFYSLYGLADQLQLIAFNEVTNYQKNLPDLPPGSVQLDLSPNASKELSDATYNDLLRGVHFWQKFTGTSPKVHMVFADRKDLDWFKETMISSQPNYTTWLDRIYNIAKDNPQMQLGGANGGDSKGNVLFFFLPGTLTKADSPGWLGVGPHEWTHQAQYIISGDINKTPCWFKEGQATYYGNAISNSDLSNWALHWKTQIQTIRYDLPAFKAMSRADLQEWFATHELNMPNNVCGPEGAFMIGGISVEYLVGAYGLDAVNEFLLELKNGIFWKEALANVANEPIENIMQKIIDYVLKIRDWAQIP